MNTPWSWWIIFLNGVLHEKIAQEKTIFKKINDKLFSIFGLAEMFISDAANNLTKGTLIDPLSSMGCKSSSGVAYHHQSNDQV